MGEDTIEVAQCQTRQKDFCAKGGDGGTNDYNVRQR